MMIQLQRQSAAAGPQARQGGIGEGGMEGSSTSSSSSSSFSSMMKLGSDRLRLMSMRKGSGAAEGDGREEDSREYMRIRHNYDDIIMNKNNNSNNVSSNNNSRDHNMGDSNNISSSNNISDNMGSKRRKIGGGSRASPPAASSSSSSFLEDGFVENAATENSVVVITMNSSCCMSHVAQRLLRSLGVNPTMIEAGGQHSEAALEAALRRKLPSPTQNPPIPTTLIPAVFIGGRLLGGVDTLLSSHISGNLIPRLKEAGALWL